MTHLYRRVGVESARESYHADRLLRWCCSDLAMPPLELRWSRYAGQGNEWWDEYGRVLEPRSRLLGGWWNPTNPMVITVRADLDLPELLSTVGHEAYHAYRHHWGYAQDESRAEAFGKRVAKLYLERKIP